jgi:hypothetical protein
MIDLLLYLLFFNALGLLSAVTLFSLWDDES